MGAGSPLTDLLHNLGTEVVIGAIPYVISTDDLKHPVPFLRCDRLQMAGICAMYFGFIAETVACVMLIFHALVLAGLVGPKIAKVFSGLIWITLTAGFLIVVLLACGIYTATWTCHNPFIPTLVIQDHFEYNYGFGFAIIGFLSSLLIFITMVFV